MIDLAYLAGPYTHRDPAVRQHRYDMLTRAAGVLYGDGVHVLSPITHGHVIHQVTPDLPHEFEFWRDICFNQLDRCDYMIVLQLDGWQISVGVNEEIKRAGEQGKMVYFMCPDAMRVMG